MKAPLPPKFKKFPPAKQKLLDELLEKSSEGKITPAELARLEKLVADAEQLMVVNAKLLSALSQQHSAKPPEGAVPVTVWVAPATARQ